MEIYNSRAIHWLRRLALSIIESQSISNSEVLPRLINFSHHIFLPLSESWKSFMPHWMLLLLLGRRKKLILDVMDFSFDYFQIFQWKEKEKKETPITSKRSSLNFVSRVESCKGLIFSPRFHPFWAQPGKLRRPYRTYRTLSFASIGLEIFTQHSWFCRKSYYSIFIALILGNTGASNAQSRKLCTLQ